MAATAVTATLREQSVACVTLSRVSAGVSTVRRDASAVTASLGIGDSRAAGPASVTGTLRRVTPRPGPAPAAGTTPAGITVTGAWMVSMETRFWDLESTAARVHALATQEVVIPTGTRVPLHRRPIRSSVTADRDTQALAVTDAPLVILGALRDLGESVAPASATTTLTAETPSHVTHAAASA